MGRIAITSGDTAGSSRRAATHYGRRGEEGGALSEHNVKAGLFKQVTTFRYDQLPTADLDALVQKLPAGSRVLSAKLIVQEDFVGGTSLAVGTSQPDGTVIDADGLVAATVTATLVDGAYVDGAGAQVGAATGLTTDACVTVTAVGTYTAGEATLVVEYEKSQDRQQAMNG